MNQTSPIKNWCSMPRIRIPPDPPDKVFGLAEPSDMFYKLGWEIAQLRDVLSRPVDDTIGFQTAAYHAFNCAVTAWHLADWIWESGTAECRINILAKLERWAPAKKPKNPFTEFQLALMERYRSLHICRQLATGAKHKIIVDHADPEVAAKEDWYGEPLRVGGSVGSRLIEYMPRLMIIDRGETRDAIEVFEDAWASWKEFLRELSYFEPELLR
jgi:hypothetical protein